VMQDLPEFLSELQSVHSWQGRVQDRKAWHKLPCSNNCFTGASGFNKNVEAGVLF